MGVPVVGRLLEAARRQAGLSARQAGEALGVSHVTVRGWEREETRPTWEHAGALARLYGVHLDELVGIESSDVRRLSGEWPAGLKEFIGSSLADQVRLMPREVLMLARAGWQDPRERRDAEWMLLLIDLRHLRGEEPATGNMPARGQRDGAAEQ